MQIVVNIARLVAVHSCRATQDVRYYLNGIYIEPADDGKGALLVATDGHRMAVIRDTTVRGCTDPVIIYIDKPPLSLMRKAAAFDPDQNVTINLEETPEHKDDKGCTVERSIANYGNIEAPGSGLQVARGNYQMLLAPISRIDGRYPYYRRVVPAAIDTPSGCIRLRTKDLAALEALFPTEDGTVTLRMAGDGVSKGVICTHKDLPDRFALIMPSGVIPHHVDIPGVIGPDHFMAHDSRIDAMSPTAVA